MDLVNGMNAISSQVWAIILVLLGIGSFVFSAHFQEQDVRAALMTSATGMVAAGIAMFQHQPKDSETTTTISTTPQEKI